MRMEYREVIVGEKGELQPYTWIIADFSFETLVLSVKYEDEYENERKFFGFDEKAKDQVNCWFYCRTEGHEALRDFMRLTSAYPFRENGEGEIATAVSRKTWKWSW